MIGQCHKYNEYERRPILTTGLDVNILNTGLLLAPPTRIRKLVPTTTGTAPGNGKPSEPEEKNKP